MNDPSMQMWLLARTSGILAYGLLTIAVVAGLTLKTRLLGRTVKPAVIAAVHASLSTVGLVAVIVHVALLVLDTKVDIPLVAAFVPGMSDYRTLATGLGVVSVELWVVIHFSFALRSRIGVRRWRSLHRLTFGVWGLALVHGLAAGTDSAVPWLQDAYAISAALVIGLLTWRITTSSGARTPAGQPRRAPRTPLTTPEHGAPRP